VSWAGAVLLLLAVGQLGALGVAVLLESDAFLVDRADSVVTYSAMGLLGLQALAAIAVLRMWRWWRGIAMLLAFVGAALHGVNLGPPPDPPVVVGISAAAAALYLIVVLLLARSRAAFR
jgi:hypothetical protein